MGNFTLREMKNIELLPADTETREEIKLLSDKLAASAGIFTGVLSFENNIIRLRVEQKLLKNGFILNQAQLVARGSTVLAPLGNKYKIHFVPLTYRPDFKAVDHNWIINRMNEFKLRNKDISKQLAIAKSDFSPILSGKNQLTDIQKSAFFYYFLQFDTKRDFRETSHC